MKRTTVFRWAAAVLCGSLTLAATTAAAAPPATGLNSTALVRGTTGEFRMTDRDTRFVLGAGKPIDIVLVRATLEPGGSTGWHTHNGRSVVLVESGVLSTQEVRHRKCVNGTIHPGEAFEHPEKAHNFINKGSSQLVFYVTYFLPVGAAPSPIDAPVPAACS